MVTEVQNAKHNRFSEKGNGIVHLQENMVHYESGVTATQPRIFMWEIAGECCYVGKCSRDEIQPLQEYDVNIRRMYDDLPYRNSSNGKYRAIHYALKEALEQGKKIRLVFLENVPPSQLVERRRELIETRQPTLQSEDELVTA